MTRRLGRRACLPRPEAGTAALAADVGTGVGSPTWRLRITERSPQCHLLSGRSAPPRWSARCRSRPTSAPGSRSSTRCAPPCSRSGSASSPERRRRSSSDTYYVALLHASGCTSNGHEAAQLYGDDIAHRAAFYLIDPTNPAEVLAFYRAYVGVGRPPGGAREADRGRDRQRRPAGARRVRDDVRGGAAVRRVARPRRGHQAALEYVFARWDGRGFPDVAGDADPVADAPAARGAGTSRCSSPPPGPTRRAAVIEQPGGRRVRAAARRARRAELRRRSSPGSTRRGCGSRRSRASRPRRSGSRASGSTPAFAAIAAITGLKSPWLREHSTGVAELAEAAAWRMGLPTDVRHARAARRARARPRPGRRVECDLGEARTARVRRVGARAAAPALHRARIRPVRLRSRRSGCWPARTTSGSTAPATTAARAGRRSTRPPASSPPPTATRPCARRGRTGRRSMRAAAEAELLREAEEGRLDPEAVDAVLAPPATACGSDRASCPPG